MTKEEMIRHKTSVNSRIKEVRKRMKPIKCPLCKRPLGKACNSHSVPRMILNTISKDGYLYNKNIVDNIDFTDSINGINKTGTFQYICRTCDNNFFADYEQPEVIHTYPSDKMLVEIAIKNVLQKCKQRLLKAPFLKQIH